MADYPFSWLYSTNTGVIIPGWSTSGSWVVGANGFGPPTNNNTVALYTPSKIGSLNFSATITDYYSTSANYSVVNLLLMSQDTTDFNNCYAMNIAPYALSAGTGNTIKLFKLVGGSITKTYSVQGFLPPATGTALTITAQAIVTGSTVRFGFTVNGLDVYPPDWQDSSSAYLTGYCGFYNSSVGSASVPFVTALQITGVTTPIPTSIQWARSAGNPFVAPGTAYNGYNTSTDLQVGHFTWDPVNGEFIGTVCPYASTNAGVYPATFFKISASKVFSYVANSLCIPTGGKTVLGGQCVLRLPNTGAFGSNANKYAFYAQYNDASNNFKYINGWYDTGLDKFNADHSSFLVRSPDATVIIPAGIADVNGQADCHATLNPVTGDVDMTYTGIASGARSLMIASATDGVSFGAGAVIKSQSNYDKNGPIGSADIYYDVGPDGSGNARYWTWDCGAAAGFLNKAIGWQPYTGSGTWGALQVLGDGLYCNPSNAWESNQVLDGGSIGVFDFGDGNGPVAWHVYVGSNNNATVNGLNGNIAMAYIMPTAPTLGLLAMRRRRRLL